MNDIGPYSNYRLTVRLELANKPGMFAKVASALAEEGANLGAVDLASATAEEMVRDVTFDVRELWRRVEWDHDDAFMAAAGSASTAA